MRIEAAVFVFILLLFFYHRSIRVGICRPYAAVGVGQACAPFPTTTCRSGPEIVTIDRSNLKTKQCVPWVGA